MNDTLGRPFWFALPVICTLVCCFVLGPVQSVQAKSAEVKVPGVAAKQIPAETVGQAGLRAHTVYMNGSSGMKNATKNMNRLHEVMREKGWTFESLVPHLENNDLEGWWITYVAR